MSSSSRRSVLIGKGRRVTIEEVISVAVSRDGQLEVLKQEKEQLDKDDSVVATRVDSVVATLQSAIKDNDESSWLSESLSLTVLTLLSLAVAQGRLLSDVNNDETTTTTTTESVVECFVSLSHRVVRLPSDPHELVAALWSSWSSWSSSSSLSVNVVSRIVSLSRAVLAAGLGRCFLDAADCVAALSAERCRVDPTVCFADTLFDAWRPHRGCIQTANHLRAMLQGSRYCAPPPTKGKAVDTTTTTTTVVTTPTVTSVRNTPQYHGPAREAIGQVCKTLELELNCSEPGPGQVLDDTVVTMSSVTLSHALNTLRTKSMERANQTTTTNTTTTDDLEQTVLQLQEALQDEARVNAQYIYQEAVEAHDKAKKKEEQKAQRAAELEKAKKQQNNNNNEDEFKGMTEAQKNKILKKRAEKEAKAKAKKAAKAGASNKNNNNGSGNKDSSNPLISIMSSLFGMGTGPLLSLLLLEPSSSSSELPPLHPLTPQLTNSMSLLLSKLLSGGVQRKPKIAKGTRDYLPAQMRVRQQAFAIIRRVFQSHGAVEIDTPVFELKETLTGKYGEDSKLIYDLADQGGELLALRYDLTVPFARFLASHPVGNIRRFHIGKVYRRDQPQLSRGRYREFYQCDFDIAGHYGRMVPDAECLCVACEILAELPLGVDFRIKLNHRRLLDAILDLCGVPADKFRTICSAVDKLDKEPWAAVHREMVNDKGLTATVADRIGTFVLQKGRPWELYESLTASRQFADHAGASTAMEDLRILFGYLEAMGKLDHIVFDLSLARGLDYYTGVIYEAVCVSGDTAVGSIGGGGRYDNLVSMFQEAGKVTPCVGVSVGIERVFTLMEKHLEKQQAAASSSNNNESSSGSGSGTTANVDVLIASAGAAMLTEKMKIARRLWDAKISAEFSQADNVKLKHEIASALDKNIPFMVLVGEEEAKENKCKIKDLKNRTEDLVSVDDLVGILLKEKKVLPVGCEFALEFMETLKK